MVVLIKNCRVFSPEALGKTDVLVLGDKIAAVGPDLSADFNGKVPVDIIDGSGSCKITAEHQSEFAHLRAAD